MQGHKACIQAEEYELSKNPGYSGWPPTLSPFHLCSSDELLGHIIWMALLFIGRSVVVGDGSVINDGYSHYCCVGGPDAGS
jgi:hypothetical protein